ncbi:MAG: Maf family protein [Candidatus Pacebacteria bacterium]|nr:Maf family protein [Candidatus Paceibacterota bacterium]
MKIILATTSPYRIEAFKFLGIPFVVEGSNVDESQVERKDPRGLVRDLSRLKAESVAQNQKEEVVVIGMDSVGCFQGKILEKPKSREDAFERLTILSGNCYSFFTGIHMIYTAATRVTTINRTQSSVVENAVRMRNISREEINKYLDQDPAFKTYAQGYDPLKGIGSSFIKGIEGSYNNILRGIPLEEVVEMLKKWDIIG